MSAPKPMQVEPLKPLEAITSPDTRNFYFVIEETEARGQRPSLEHLHEIVSEITLNDTVPSHIRNHFSHARNLAVYSWFHYPFHVTSQLMGFVSVEYALKERSKSKANFQKLIRLAVTNGWITDEGFRISRHRAASEKSYVETLVNVMPNLRNTLAHGSSMQHNNAVASLQICADFINQLFPVSDPTA